MIKILTNCYYKLRSQLIANLIILDHPKLSSSSSSFCSKLFFALGSSYMGISTSKYLFQSKFLLAISFSFLNQSQIQFDFRILSIICLDLLISRIPFMVGSPDILTISDIPSSNKILISLSLYFLVIYRIYISLCCINSSTSSKLSSSVWSICFLSILSSSTIKLRNLFSRRRLAIIRLILNSQLIVQKNLVYQFSTFNTEQIVRNLIFTSWFLDSLYSILQKLYRRVSIYATPSAVSFIQSGIFCYSAQSFNMSPSQQAKSPTSLKMMV